MAGRIGRGGSGRGAARSRRARGAFEARSRCARGALAACSRRLVANREEERRIAEENARAPAAVACAPATTRYTHLSIVIGIFVALVSVLTVVIFVSRLGAFEWPWELKWAQTVPLEILNFAVIAAVCIIWRPTERHKLLVQPDYELVIMNSGGV